ncbi:MAG: hypothetical protein J0H74_03275 [Chitinophagaceae bacterium]|nr:hypothetical protein [Chitinophagaceae bacterium]
MKKTLVLAVTLVAIFNLSATIKGGPTSFTKPITSGRLAIGPQALIRPFCGPNILYQQIGSDPISSIRIQGPGMTPIIHTSPTLPFSEVYGSFNLTIIVSFLSGSGSMRLTWDDQGGSLVDCETYSPPHYTPIPASLTCGNYTLTITDNGTCD